MKLKGLIIAIFGTCLAMNTSSWAVDTKLIDKVRVKDVLDDKDLEVIDGFVAEAIEELVQTKDFTSISRLRTTVIAYSSSRLNQGQYSAQFSDSAHDYISRAFKQAEQLTPHDYKFKVILNLLILLDGLQDVRLADLAISMLNDNSAPIRYWAVHAVTNSGIIKQLNSTDRKNLKLASEITDRFSQMVDRSEPEITTLIVEFAASVNTQGAEELLLKIVNMRTEKYANWTVDYELMDIAVLKSLYRKISSAETSKPTIARGFAQLYSYAMQRYVKGGSFLSKTQKAQLGSILIEVENCCIWRLLGKFQTVIKKAVSDGNDGLPVLVQEHTRLFGDGTTAGELALKLNFDYGQTPDGRKSIGALVLSEPPKTKVVE